MNIISGVKQGWVKYEDDKGNFKKRYAVLQDNVMLFYASEKDIMSKNDIVLSKVTTVVICSEKKGFCFTITTKDGIHAIRVESQELMNEWINAINSVSKIHILRDKFKDCEINLSNHYKHNLITSCKKTIQLVSRVIGITKAVILASKGKLKSSKLSENIDPEKVQSSSNKLTLSLISFTQATLKCVEDVYNKSLRDNHIQTIETLRIDSRAMSNYGEGTQNESALFSTLHQLLKELDFIQQLPLPSPKTDVLHTSKMISDQLDKIHQLVKEDEIEKEVTVLCNYANELQSVAKKVFLLIPDVTYAKPLTDLGNIVPKIAKDTGDLLRKAYHYQVVKTHAMNASKTLHLVLNQIREVIKAAFPFEERETLYPPSGPEDTRFKLFTQEEINNMLMEQSSSLLIIEDDQDELPPPPPPEDDEMYPVEGEMILHDSTSNTPQSIKLNYNHPRTMSEPTEFIHQPNNDPNQGENILFELDNLLEDVNNRRSSLQLNSVASQINSAPGSTPLPYKMSPRGKKSSFSSNFTITNAIKINETNLSSSPMTIHNSPGSSILSSSPYQPSFDVQSDTSDKNVVDELDALLQLQTNKTNL